MKYRAFIQQQGLQFNPLIPAALLTQVRRFQNRQKADLLEYCRENLEPSSYSLALTKPELIEAIALSLIDVRPLYVVDPHPKAKPSRPQRKSKRGSKEPQERLPPEDPEEAPMIHCESCGKLTSNWDSDLVATSWMGQYANYCRKCKKAAGVESFEQSRISVSLHTNQTISL